ncbi:MAG TPA: tetratricopeptide repeat protein [Bryobacteraceae bacterium]|jgi:tetratricopeptide (TPR) repeat protein|nr:tetratricopeptide repeat protein [Bryobacteraceae bacterium]
MKRFVPLAALLFTVLPAVRAQQASTPGKPVNPVGGAINAPPPSGNISPPASSNNGSPNPESSMPVFLSGKVVMADGSPVPDNVTIQRTCGIATRNAAYTDRKGRFNFQWGQTMAMMPDAAEPSSGGVFGGPVQRGNPFGNPGGFGGAGGSSMMGCELRADAPGYRSDSIRLDDRRAMENPDVGTIVLHRLANVQGFSVSATAFQAPPEARKAYDKGVDAMHKGKNAEAEKNFEKAVGLYSRYANAWLDLGKVKLRNRQEDSAREAFQKALDADAKLVEAHVELGLIATGKSQWTEAATHLDTALQLDPVDYPRAWFADGVAQFNLKNLDSAEKSAREALKLDPKHTTPAADQLLAMILAAKGDYSGAVSELNLYLRLLPPGATGTARAKAQLAEIQRLAENENKP